MEAHTRALTRWVGTLIDRLVRGGVSQFVVCPGSRSTPLALAAARHPAARIWVQMDERSAAFFALGMARQRGEPVALICTSGTAVANFLPAVAEADLARVPLILLTADRPHELRNNGAPQTIDQVGIFGSTTRWAVDLPPPGDSPDLLAFIAATAARAIAAASGPPAGPVQLNLPLREPLVPDRTLLGELFAAKSAPVVQVTTGPRQVPPAVLDDLAQRLDQVERGLILCGPDCPPGLAPLVTTLAVRLGFPVLADPLSGVRHGPHGHALILSAYDAFLRDEAFAARYDPDLVLRFGAMPTAKPVLQLLQRHRSATTVVVDPAAGWREPTSLATLHLAAEPLALCKELLARLGESERTSPWCYAWATADAVACHVLGRALAAREALNEPGVFHHLGEILPAGATLFVGNSMPVRDCDTFLPAQARPLTISGNRGANGIDGLVSTALGEVAGGAGPLVLAIGDLSLYHDSNGLLAAKLHGLSMTVVLINNDGGGIFHFLPQASESDQFERLFGTPHGLEFRPLAELYGAHYTLAESWEQFRAAVSAGIHEGGLRIVEVRTERTQNVADHRALWPLVSAALNEAGLT